MNNIILALNARAPFPEAKLPPFPEQPVPEVSGYRAADRLDLFAGSERQASKS
ncbi:hypothetical protein [Sphingomonas sp. LB3N6]|uniref:hypothetical protein n=1 Tax=Sphingomonas fucosidasi TaxID=3096164 RepID=UPI002FCC92B1